MEHGFFELLSANAIGVFESIVYFYDLHFSNEGLDTPPEHGENYDFSILLPKEYGISFIDLTAQTISEFEFVNCTFKSNILPPRQGGAISKVDLANKMSIINCTFENLTA